jgi:Uma2 family endonuclease
VLPFTWMAAAVTLPLEAPGPQPEQRILLNGVSWKDYVILRDVLDGPTPRMTYVDGTLELMSPSSNHELWKTNIGRLLDFYAYARGIDLRGYGSTTLKRDLKARAAEPDECYLIGTTLRDYPQIVLEVVHSAPLLDKRDVYASMGVQEVWVFEAGAFTLYTLDATTETYAVAPRSGLLPGLDFALVARYAVREDTLAALREFAADIGA